MRPLSRRGRCSRRGPQGQCSADQPEPRGQLNEERNFVVLYKKPTNMDLPKSELLQGDDDVILNYVMDLSQSEAFRHEEVILNYVLDLCQDVTDDILSDPVTLYQLELCLKQQKRRLRMEYLARIVALQLL